MLLFYDKEPAWTRLRQVYAGGVLSLDEFPDPATCCCFDLQKVESGLELTYRDGGLVCAGVSMGIVFGTLYIIDFCRIIIRAPLPVSFILSTNGSA